MPHQFSLNPCVPLFLMDLFLYIIWQGYERSRGTPAGDKASNDYNANIQEYTMRWAMLDALEHAPACFKEVIQTHFKLKKDQILKQCESWIESSRTPPATPSTDDTQSPSTPTTTSITDPSAMLRNTSRTVRLLETYSRLTALLDDASDEWVSKLWQGVG